MRIRTATEQEMPTLAELEKLIEERDPQEAASEETLRGRFHMHPHGFFVAEEERRDKSDGEVKTLPIGYLQTCRWSRELGEPGFRTFDEIRNFPEKHDPEGPILYIIYLGVLPEHRKKGVGTALVETAIRFAKENGMRKVQLAAEPPRFPFYQHSGLQQAPSGELPNFVSGDTMYIMEYRCH
eukprot:gb/GECG01001412.1/.p1 GENE.gb/GECG01001412.1/~~gb/GECG01001412.1/.p1  ORF type:complete len:182 (+),score=21.12 gb/GECG01001412.1/:1-546(+)